jgi:hypothetical protein
MKIRFLKEWNTSQAYVAAGTECERPDKDAKVLIDAGIAEAVKEKEAKHAPKRS